MNTLQAMRRKGFIEFCDQTGEIIETLYSRVKHRCYYIHDGQSSFTYKGETYGVKYFDGCFMPYVVKYDNINTERNSTGIVLGL